MTTVEAKRAEKSRGQYSQSSLRPSRCEEARRKDRGGQEAPAFADEAAPSSHLTQKRGGGGGRQTRGSAIAAEDLRAGAEVQTNWGAVEGHRCGAAKGATGKVGQLENKRKRHASHDRRDESWFSELRNRGARIDHCVGAKNRHLGGARRRHSETYREAKGGAAAGGSVAHRDEQHVFFFS